MSRCVAPPHWPYADWLAVDAPLVVVEEAEALVVALDVAFDVTGDVATAVVVDDAAFVVDAARVVVAVAGGVTPEASP